MVSDSTYSKAIAAARKAMRDVGSCGLTASGWHRMDTAPNGLVQLWGNDPFDEEMRTMPGFADPRDGALSVAMDQTGQYPFNAVAWRPLSEGPK